MEKIREKVKDFYEHCPYPRQLVRSKEDITQGKHAQVMKTILKTVGLAPARLAGIKVLDAGCGTGEKAAYCAIYGARVDAFDISKNSINHARENAGKLGLEVNYFVDSFERVELAEGCYDLVLCIGSLHHTDDPQGNFYRMAKLVKPGGTIALGLYNTYGRLGCRLHRHLLGAGVKDPHKIMEMIGVGGNHWHGGKNAQKEALLADRFASPHETYHSVEEVLGWFKKSGIAPYATHPRVNLGSAIDPKIKQISWLVKNKGFFFVGGRKRQEKN